MKLDGPVQEIEVSVARKQLEESVSFQRSSALLALLDFLLESAQQGPIKEISVGAEFFNRAATYDPRLDSIARVNVRRLRQKLEQYYASEGAEDAFQISIPTGSFTPVITPGPQQTLTQVPAPVPLVEYEPVAAAPAQRKRWLGPLVLLLPCLCAGVLLASRYREHPFPTGSWRTEPLTLGRELEFEPATTRDGKRLAYVSRLSHSLQFRIFERELLAKSDAGALLDTGPGDALYPAWSPDSTQLAFLRCGAGNCEIDTILAQGGPVRQVRTLPLYSLQDDQAYYQFRQLGPVWTHDGRSLIFPFQAPGDDAERLIEQDLTTGTSQQLTFGEPGDDDGAPAISRDGKNLALLRRNLDHTDVMTLAFKTGAARVLETEPTHAASGITWAPDGSGVVVGVLRRASAPGLLYVPLSGSPRVLGVSLPGLMNPVFTGDGKAMMVLSTNRNRNIAEITGDGNDPAYIFNSKQRNSFLALSPDNSHLAFLSSLTGTFELWLCDRTGSKFGPPRRLTHGLPYYPFSVAWSPDGRTIAVAISHTSKVEMVDAQTGSFQPLQVPGLERSDIWSPAWAADGRSIFLAIQGERKGVVRASTTLISGIESIMQGDAEEIRLDSERALYFTTGNRRGIYKLSLTAGARPELIAGLAGVDPARDWIIEAGKLYYLDVHDPSRRVRTYDLLTGQIDTITQPVVRPAFLDGSLAYDPKDHLVLYSEWSEEAGSQIYMLYPSGKPLNEDEPK